MNGDMVAVLELLARLLGSASSVCMLLMVAKVHATWQRYQLLLVPLTCWQRAPPRRSVRQHALTLAVGTVVDRHGWLRCTVGNVHDERIRRRP